MPDVTIPAELTLVLRRTLIDEYGTAAEEAQHAADHCLCPADDDPGEVAAMLVTKRMALLDYEQMFKLLGDDLVQGDDVDVPPDDRRIRGMLAELVDRAITVTGYMNGDMSPDVDLIVTTGRRLERLQALRDEVEPAEVPA